MEQNSITFTKLNELLSNIPSLRCNIKPIQTNKPDENTIEEFYLIDLLYIKIIIGVDSYGENETVKGIQFVKPKESVSKIFETI